MGRKGTDAGGGGEGGDMDDEARGAGKAQADGFEAVGQDRAGATIPGATYP